MGTLFVFVAALLAFGLSTVSGAGRACCCFRCWRGWCPRRPCRRPSRWARPRVRPRSWRCSGGTFAGPSRDASCRGRCRVCCWGLPAQVPQPAVSGGLHWAVFAFQPARRAAPPRPAPAAPAERAGWLKLSSIGLLAGFLSGLTGAVGLLFNKFYFRYGLSRDEVIATRAANEVLLRVIKLALYLYLGLLTGPAWRAGAVVAVAAVLATAGARRVVGYLSERLFQRIGYGAMVLSGVFMLAAAGQELRTTENLWATTRLFGDELEITGWWRSTSLTLELGEGPAIEQPVTLASLPAAVQARIQAQRRGRPLVKLEEVWTLRQHYYEVYFNENGRVRSEDVAVAL
ncbi:MAG: TSUP family transporter [Hymenobacter sp.]